MQAELLPGERLDDLQTGGYRLIQRPGSFCFGTDAVLLADFAAPRRKDRAADLGTGTGVIALLMAAHQPGLQVDAVELQADMADMAARSVRLNGLEARICVHQGDMRQLWKKLGQGSKSLVVCNPPYERENTGPVSVGESQRIARHEGGLTIGEVARSAAQLLKFGGRFCVIYPARRAFELMCAMQAVHLQPKRIRTVHARADRAPKLILIEAIKGAAEGINWMAPLMLCDADGSPSAEWRRIYQVK